jgi:hypothetical protein
MARPISVAFYRQQRRDGAVRTGIEIEGDTVLGRFENEAEEWDPVLAWWMDVRCEGRRLPVEAEAARQWFLDHANVIHQGLQTLAAELQAGLDFNTWPLLWEVPKPPRGVHMVIACCASRRLDGRAMAGVLSEIDEHWEERIRTLPATEPITR